jgi:small ligand-binding sensory domain FIST
MLCRKNLFSAKEEGYVLENRLIFASALSTEREVERSVEELVAAIQAQLQGNAPHLILVFLSTHFTPSSRQIVDRLNGHFKAKALLGCTAEGVIGREHEIEGEPAIALIAGYLPGIELAPFLLPPSDSPLAFLDEEEFRWYVDAPEETKLFILIGDPFSMPMSDVLLAFNGFYPGVPVVGGMASGALRPGGNILFLNDQVMDGGAVGVGLGGRFDIDVIVSQGCRPIWDPMTVTGSEKNIIFSLEGQPPLAIIQELVQNLSEEDRFLLQGGLFIGRAIDSQRERFGRGDFLVRGVVGVDPQKGAIAIGDYVQDGETVQFHLRDAVTAQEDLEMMLLPQQFRTPPSGGLLFTCNGRGLKLYDHPDGDIAVIQKNLGDIHLAGIFCAGEIGPVGAENFLHGHTASLVLFRPGSPI